MTLIQSLCTDECASTDASSSFIHARYTHLTTHVDTSLCPPLVSTEYHPINFRTKKNVSKVGLMLVGWGGNNGSTLTASIVANKYNINWNTKNGLQRPNYLGSLLLSSTTRVGSDSKTGKDVFIPMNKLLPMIDPAELKVGGWDISSLNLSASLERAAVMDYDLQIKLEPYLKSMIPLPSVYYPDFFASNQNSRADNVIPGNDKQKHLEQIRKDIQQFKAQSLVDSVIVVWTATTERLSEIIEGVNDTSENLLKAISDSHPAISPSTLFSVASILENAPFINGSPQNTFVPGCVQLAEEKNVFIAGDDFKSGQTKFKSVMVDFLIGAGLRPRSIVSYNHLGNNDGRNLSSPHQFKSKEVSKSNVVDDMVSSNEILYGQDDKAHKPDHAIVIKYIPAVGDTKRAIDEYESDIFMNGRSTFVIHNTCEDSLLAAPLILDLVLMTELCSRISYNVVSENDIYEKSEKYRSLHTVLSILSYWLKAPLVPSGTPIVNALFKQRACIENFLRVCSGLPVETELRLEHRMNISKKICHIQH